MRWAAWSLISLPLGAKPASQNRKTISEKTLKLGASNAFVSETAGSGKTNSMTISLQFF